MDLSGANVLVTGGCGMIGSRLMQQLAARGARVAALDSLTAYPFDYAERYGARRCGEVIQADVRDLDTVWEAVKGKDFVIHAAAFADVAGCVNDYGEDFGSNVAGTQNVLDACIDHRPERLVFISSASVYGNPQGCTSFCESSPLVPVSTYGNSKLWGENQARLFFELYGLRTTSLRYFSIYGPPQVPKQGSHSWCVAIFAMQAMRSRSLTVFGDGRQIRDFIHVDDVAAGTIRAMLSESCIGQTLNLGTGKPTSINEVARMIGERFDGVQVQFCPARAGDPRGGAADVSLMQRLLDWTPPIGMSEGVAGYCDWVNENKDLIPEWI